MAGKGAIPKPVERLAGKGAAKARRGQIRTVESEPVPQPVLPEFMPNGDEWPARTVEWWAMWGRDPLAAEFRATDWSELMDTAAIHGAYWSGELKLAGELRLRTAKFGSTAEDRARLRVQYASADRADSAGAHRAGDSAVDKVQRRYPGLRAVDK